MDNQQYISQMYQKWQKNPNSVFPDWQEYFQKYQKYQKTAKKDTKQNFSLLKKMVKMTNLYRSKGYMMADLDPLRMDSSSEIKLQAEEKFLDSKMQFSQEELNQKEKIPQKIFHKEIEMSPQELKNKLQRIYQGKISYKYSYIPNEDIQNWIQERIEDELTYQISKEEKLNTLKVLLESQVFNEFFQEKFKGKKIYSVEGIDSFISGFQEIILESVNQDIKSIDIATANRGRLNLLNLIANKPAHEIFAYFHGTDPLHQKNYVYNFLGDVPYHQSAYNKLRFKNGKSLSINISPNACHLESIYPVILGSVKAKLDNRNWDTNKILPVIVHGDTSITGQGVVFETQSLEQLRNFSVGGSLHVVLNNQLPFQRKQTRSSHFSSNISNVNRNFVIYVNAEEPDLVSYAFKLAVQYRQKWKRDVFVELVGYKKYFYQEMRNEGFIDPQIKEKLENFPKLAEKYSQQLIKEQLVDQEKVEEIKNHYKQLLEKEFEISKQGNFDTHDKYLEKQTTVVSDMDNKTGIEQEQLVKIGKKIFSIKEGFNIHPIIKKDYLERLKSMETGEKITWASAEALAFASLLDQGYNVRLTGEDVERGTFSHRQIKLTDQKTNLQYMPMEQILDKNDNRLVVRNSCLSELGVLGYEYGYSVTSPLTLVCWEAQFGDFTNGAQVIVDQFISTCETKWGRMTGMIMMLPHGYDGQGPEHSNARVERFLNSVDDDYSYLQENKGERENLEKKCNMIVCNITSSANYFHLLRQQLLREYRKPTVIMSPKKLLRHSVGLSKIEQFLPDQKFQQILDSSVEDKSKVNKIILCSGQVYVDVKEYKEKQEDPSTTAIIRLEQLAPFPYNSFEKIIQQYSKDCEILYLQEEHFNFGPYVYLRPRINLILKEQNFKNEVQYRGRRIASSTASTGLNGIHDREKKEIVESCFK